MPDAWDDDWIEKGKSSSPTPDSAPATKMSQAERRRQQAEFNRQIWERENTEKPDENFFLQTKSAVPLKSEFKPTMKVLSRKPNGGLGGLSLDDEDEDESVKKELTAEERLQKAQKDREEKQKAYEERRRQLFGKDEPSSAQPKPTTKAGSPRNQSRVKGANDSRPPSAASNRPNRQLYDPNESAKPDTLRIPKKDLTTNVIEPIREPRAPDGSGRGGFGFAPRGGRAT